MRNSIKKLNGVGGQQHVVRTDPVPLSLNPRIPMALPAHIEDLLWATHSTRPRGKFKWVRGTNSAPEVISFEWER